jgi:hypothetical protein
LAASTTALIAGGDDSAHSGLAASDVLSLIQ